MSSELRLRLGTRALRIQLGPDDGGIAATIDGDAHRVRVLARTGAAAAPGASVEELALEVDGRPERALVARSRDRLLVALRGRVYAFETGDATIASGDRGGRSGTVVAPMPGKVVAVMVALGDTVEAGQPVVVLEAMKMETTLIAEVSGRVTALQAVAGTTVDAGALLVAIAPPA
jgi:acetyl/propionyl-CoA carboxylase alpha subunit